MMKWLTVCFCLLSVSIHAAVFKIPADCVDDLVRTKAQYEKSPSAETTFEYSMALAYSGLPKKSLTLLKKIPTYHTNYAPVVVEKYQKVVADSPRNWKAHFKLAAGYYFVNQKEKTIYHLTMASEIDPTNPWPVGYLALVTGQMGQLPEAIQIAKRALQLEPNAAPLQFLIGTGYFRSGKMVEASQYFLKAGQLIVKENKVYGKY